MSSSKELMTDDDFEKLLDELEEQKAADATVSSSEEAGQVKEDDSALEGLDDSSLDDGITIVLDPSVMIGRANDLHERLCTLLDEPAAVVFQAAEVEVIDTANIQLLLAFARDRRAKFLETEVRKPSKSFLNTVTSLGMTEVLSTELALEIAA